jgi:hypothetical protein
MAKSVCQIGSSSAAGGSRSQREGLPDPLRTGNSPAQGSLVRAKLPGRLLGLLGDRPSARRRFLQIFAAKRVSLRQIPISKPIANSITVSRATNRTPPTIRSPRTNQSIHPIAVLPAPIRPGPNHPIENLPGIGLAAVALILRQCRHGRGIGYAAPQPGRKPVLHSFPPKPSLLTAGFAARCSYWARPGGYI